MRKVDVLEATPSVTPPASTDLDHNIDEIIARNDPSHVFDLVPSLVPLSTVEYEKVKSRLKDHFGRRLSIGGLDKAVKEERKKQKRAKFASADVVGMSRPTIDIDDPIDILFPQALAALSFANQDKPFLFVQSGQVVEIHYSERKISRTISAKVSVPSIVPVNLTRMRLLLSQSAHFVRRIEAGEETITVSVDPPLDLARTVREGVDPKDYPFPPLVGIVELPIIRPDGSLSQQTGYDEMTGLFYSPTIAIPNIPQNPTLEEVHEAVDLFMYMLADFPFVDQASRSVIIAAFITVVIRTFIIGQVPLILLDAPAPGTGKTLLGKLCGIVANGRLPAVVSLPCSEEEMRKLIFTWLLESPATIVLDNIHVKIESSTLESALTTPTYGDRLLSTNKRMEVEQRAVWFATGNNIQTGQDMLRRCITCKLDAKMEKPHKRDPKKFKIQGPIETWTIESRAKIVHAALVLFRHWIAQGKPESSVTPLGNFEEWTSVLGGILQSAGIPDFLKNLEDTEGNNSIDSASESWKAFIKTIRDVYGNNPFTCTGLAKRMLDKDLLAEDLREALPTQLTKSFDSYQRSQGIDTDFSAHLGNIFRIRKGQVFDDLRFETSKVKAKGNKTQWQVASIDNATFDSNTSDISPAQQMPDTPDTPPAKKPIPVLAPPRTDLSKEHQELFAQYEASMPVSSIETVLWKVPNSGYPSGFLKPDDHIARTLSLLKSEDNTKISAAINAMKQRLGIGSEK